MKKIFAIRDDDLSYWTKVEDIRKAYEEIFSEGGKVCFSVIPFSIKALNRGSERDFYIKENSYQPIHKNTSIIKYLKSLIKNQLAEILLHGYDHTYLLKDKNNVLIPPLEGKIKPNIISWYPECIYKSENRVLDEMLRGKNYLENVFECNITTYVPASNRIGRVVRNMTMNLCSAPPTIKERGLREGMKIWYKHKFFRLINGYTFSGVTKCSNHLEIAAFGLASKNSFNKTSELLEKSFVKNLPFVLSTHYWELNKYPERRKFIKELVNKSENLSGRNGFLSEIFNSIES
tara:strand:- start:4362 stop:5231 length:870 start_codon:yes stop_codon:yes gene_type:complete